MSGWVYRVRQEWLDAGMTAGEALLCAWLTDTLDRKGSVRVTLDQLKDQLHVGSHNTLRKWMRDLQSRGLVKVTRFPYWYVFSRMSKIDIPECQKMPAGMSKSDTPECQKVTFSPIIQENNKESLKEGACAPARESSTEEELRLLQEQYRKELCGDTSANESARRVTGLTTQQLSEALDIFTDALIMQGSVLQTYGNYRRYFFNWIKINATHIFQNGNIHESTRRYGQPGDDLLAEIAAGLAGGIK